MRANPPTPRGPVPERRALASRRWVPWAAVAAVVLLSLSGLAAASGGTYAPNFTLPDIYGQNFTLSSYRGSDAVVIEFTSLSCSECQIVEKSLKTIYTQYNATGSSPVQFISIFVEPQYGDSIPALRAYHILNNITWWMAQDTDSLSTYTAYGVTDIPTVVVVDKQGYATYDQSGAQPTGQLQAAVSAGLSGNAATISIVTVSVFAVAAVAGVSTFFSPCAFPMFPGYMSLFLGLSATGTVGAPSEGTYRGALRRALFAGSVTALGMLLVFLLVGVALVFAASLVSGYIPALLVFVGGILIALGALLFTNLQYWRIVTPFQQVWRRATGRAADDSAPVVPTDSNGLYLKLFGYGMGYAAAAAGCVAPVILSAVVAGMALGLVNGIASILIYSLTAALLMIVVTLLLAVAGKRFLNQLKAYTPIIKKVSAGALVIVGVYLIYFYWSAWIA